MIDQLKRRVGKSGRLYGEAFATKTFHEIPLNPHLYEDQFKKKAPPTTKALPKIAKSPVTGAAALRKFPELYTPKGSKTPANL